MKRITERQVIAGALILLPLCYFLQAVKGSLALVQGDGWAANLGLRMLTGQMLSEGLFPLWNPYIFAGMPLLASIYPGVLYPPNWLFALLPPGVAINLVVITTYHLALIGAYRYARAIGVNRTGAVVTGCLFTFGGFLIMSMGQTSTIATAAWLPWILLALEKLYQRSSWKWVSLGAVFVALQFFAGVPQLTWYTALTAGAYFLFSATLREQRERRSRFIAAALAMSVCGALLSAIQLLPLRELQLQGGRAGLSYTEFASYSFPTRQALALVFPFLFGGASMPPYRLPYLGEWGIFVTAGYAGLAGLLLSLVALIGLRKLPLVWCWAFVAVISLILSFGSTLPFGLNHLLHRLPVYNLFRASSRHLFEFDFAIAALAGLGVSYLSRHRATRPALLGATTALSALVLFSVLFWRFILQPPASLPRPAQLGSLGAPEVLAPLCFFLLSVMVVWFYARRAGMIPATCLILVIMADLASYGHFLEWKWYAFSVAEKLTDPPSAAAIKARESNLNSFRILSYAANPFYPNYEMLCHPNLSIVRGLQSATGYDMLRMNRPAAVMGSLTPHGVVREAQAFGLFHQGFNLLNIKYLLCERPGAGEAASRVTADGIEFNQESLETSLRPGLRMELTGPAARVTNLAIITALANSGAISDGMPVARLRLHTTAGRVIERELQGGRDTAEWAWDRPGASAVIRHRRATVVESFPAPDAPGLYQAHRYLARFEFEPAEVERVEIIRLGTEAELMIARVSLFDAQTGRSFPLSAAFLPAERWRRVESFGAVDLYENLKVMPRAWFVRRVVALPSEQVLQVIRTGQFNDGAPFDPADTALFEIEDFGGRALSLPPVRETTAAEVRITSYAPQRIELATHNSQPGFLALSEIYYRGWDATLDGERIPVERVNYTLRGVAVPPGDHRIEFAFRAPSVLAGGRLTLAGLLLLLAGPVITRVRQRRRSFRLKAAAEEVPEA
jgi:hypothetical protein